MEKENKIDKIPMPYLEGELWRGIDLFEGLYEVSNLGRVRSTDYLIKLNGGSYMKKGKILKQRLSNCGEMTVCISCAQLGFTRKPYLVNRLVATAFIPNPFNLPYAMHINDNNFDNRADNLQWATAAECVRKESAKKRRSEKLSKVKAGTMPSDKFFENHKLGWIKSQLTRKRRRGVLCLDENHNLIKEFENELEAEAYFSLSYGAIYTMIKRREDGTAKIRNHYFKFKE